MSSTIDERSAALELLRTIASEWKKPEEFVEGAEAWAEHLKSATGTPGFEEIANKLFSSVSIAHAKPTRFHEHQHAAIMGRLVFNADGYIVSVDETMRKALGAVSGENIREYVQSRDRIATRDGSPIRDKAALPDCLCEVVSRSGRRLLAHCSPPSADTGMRTVSIYRVDFPVLVESYLRWSVGLTATEMDIIRLTLQRASPNEIAEMRRTRINTVRTHINSIIRKFRCRSITEVIAAIYELSAIPESHLCDDTQAVGPAPRGGSILKIGPNASQIEYFRYGPEGGRPIVILHSIDYGVSPPREFLAAAAERKFTPYLLLRPGFGRSTPAQSIREAAENLNLAINGLGLRGVIVVAMSSAGPVALELSRISRRIDLLVSVNNLLIEGDKLIFAKPNWVRGILDLANWSPESFRYALKMTRGVIRIAGPKAFFDSIYASQQADLAYAHAHPGEIEDICQVLLGAADESVRLDLTSSFHRPSDFEAADRLGLRYMTVLGENTHGVSPEEVSRLALMNGQRHATLHGAGRNCAYQKPDEFFMLIEERLSILEGRDRATASV